MTPYSFDHKRILFLQGPHGPFFSQLAKQLRKAGAETFKIGFNAGDAFFWMHRDSYIAFDQPLDQWSDFLADFLAREGITDIVLYGDVRPVHAEAIAQADAKGVVVHCFEEGYLRPYWATYERGGVNGHSRLMKMTIAEMEQALEQSSLPLVEAPAKWGDVKQHALLGAVYHWHILYRNKAYPHYTPHRGGSVRGEFKRHVKRLLTTVRRAVARWKATRAISNASYNFHLVLLQLGHDTSIQAHSPFKDMRAFIIYVMAEFAENGLAHHHLVFKAHPLEDFRQPLDQIVREEAARHGLSHRVHFVMGGKLAGLLDMAKSVLTVNSTAGQQALWRALPLKSFGDAVYNKPELVSDQPLGQFFKQPKPPSKEAYATYRRFLLLTSQLQGGFYARKSRIRLMRGVVDKMLDPVDPYARLVEETGTKLPQLKVVKPE